MIEVNDKIQVSSPSSNVLKFIHDPENFSNCLPNLQEFKKSGQDSFQAVFKVEIPKNLGVTYIQNLSVKMSFITQNSLDSATFKGEGRTAGIKIRLSLDVKVTSNGMFSLLDYNGSLDAGLFEKFLGKERLEAMAKEISTQIINCMLNKLKSI